MGRLLGLVLVFCLLDLNSEFKGSGTVSNTKIKRGSTIIILRIDSHERAMSVSAMIILIKNNINKLGVIVKSDVHGYAA